MRIKMKILHVINLKITNNINNKKNQYLIKFFLNLLSFHSKTSWLNFIIIFLIDKFSFNFDMDSI